MLAREIAERQRLNTSTPQGIHNLILAETGNKELAEKAQTEMLMQQTMARMMQQGSPL